MLEVRVREVRVLNESVRLRLRGEGVRGEGVR